jgi:hypothetical protein
MMSEQEERKNELEFLLQAGRDGNVSLGTVFQALLRSPIWVLLNKEVQEGDNPEDIRALMVKDKEGGPMMVMFTEEEHTAEIRERNPEYKFPRQVPAAGILDSIAANVGIVINPGMSYGLQITADGVVQLKNRLERQIAHQARRL